MDGKPNRSAAVPQNLISWRDEDHLWEWMLPQLRGKWTKLEAVYPSGLPDSFGLFYKETIWLEHKIGPPSIDALRPKQREFGHDCMRRGVPYFVAFGHLGGIKFFDDYSFSRPLRPRWWIPSAVDFRGTVRGQRAGRIE